MNTKKPLKPIPWFSGSLATLAALLIVGVELPNIPRGVIDNTVSPPRVYIEEQPGLLCVILAVAFVPVLCIFILGRRWIFFNWFGWIVLAFLLVAAFMG
jgi:hypothetical protein